MNYLNNKDFNLNFLRNCASSFLVKEISLRRLFIILVVLLFTTPALATQTELIINGSFSSGTSGWTPQGWGFWAGTNSANYRTAPGYAALGVDGAGSPVDNFDGVFYQTITIPANATSATLSFWYYITSTDSATTAYDEFYVTIRDASYNQIGSYVIDPPPSNVNASAGYVQETLDLTQQKGQKIYIRFGAKNDSSHPTVFRIDDVSVLAVTPNLAQITIGPSSLNFGSVQVGTCSAASYSIQHVNGTDTATGTIATNSAFTNTSGTSFSLSNGQSKNVNIQFCPTSASTFNGSSTINSSAIMNISSVSLSGAGFIPQPTTGALQVNALLDGSPWSGQVNYNISGPVNLKGTNVPADFQDRNQGTYTLSYTSGGPSGATLSNITPSSSQTLSGGGAITFTMNFSSQIIPPQITIGPSSLNFGSVQVGSCSTAPFAIQHVSGTGAASGTITTNSNPPFSITSNSNFSVSNGQGINVDVQFCPTSAGQFSGSVTINSNANMNISAVSLSGQGFNPTPTTGAVQVNATLDGSSWSGLVNYTLTGPASLNGTNVPADFQDKPVGSYTLTYNSGGPSGATLSSTTPSSTQTLTGGGIITFTMNFSIGLTPCPESISPVSKSFGSGGGTDKVNVVAPDGCNWTASSSDPSWLYITSGNNGTGDGTVNYSVLSNTGSSRTGTITIVGDTSKTLTVTQDGGPIGPTPCPESISPVNKSFGPGGGTDSVAVNASGSCNWTASSSDPSWLKIASGISGTGNGTVEYSVLSNTGSLRTGTITIAGEKFTVTQFEIDEKIYGTTIITHGTCFDINPFEDLPVESPGDSLPYELTTECEKLQDWVKNMAGAIANRIGSAEIKIYNKDTGLFDIDQVIGNPKLNGESILIFDWASDSNNQAKGFSEAAGEALFAALIKGEKNNIKGENNNDFKLENLHFIGHSRGCVVNSEAVERLIKVRKTVVDHVTTLDPVDGGYASFLTDYDVNQSLTKNGIVSWIGVNWADNYYSTDGSGPKDPDGRSIPGTFEFNLTDFGKIKHSDVHAWYHGTIDTDAEDDNNGDGIEIRDDWYGSLGRKNSGYISSRIGGSIRPSIIGNQTPIQFAFYKKGHGIVNGDFRRGILNSIPGWEEHGGGGTGQRQAGHLKLYSTLLLKYTWREHNRFYIPEGETKIGFRYRIVNRSLGPNYDRLRVSIGGNTVLEIPLDYKMDVFKPTSIDVSEYDDSVQTIKFEIVKGGSFIDSEVWIDDIGFGIIPDININGFEKEIIVGANDMLSIEVSLNAVSTPAILYDGSSMGNGSDWWFVVLTPSGEWKYYDLAQGTFKTGLKMSYQGSLNNLSSTTILLNTSDMSAGTYTYYFGIDLSMNGTVYAGEGQLYNDSIEVTVVDTPLPRIYANGSEDTLTISKGKELSIAVSYATNNYSGTDADWWVVVMTPSGEWQHYDLDSRTFTPGFDVTYQSPLVNLGSTEIFNTSGLGAGTYTYYFGVDLNMNGTLDMGEGQFYYDSVVVNITP